jgi:DNA-binding PadR family transcriptional regulator
VDELIRLMPDVPTGSLYRHLNMLVDSELVVVTGKQGVRGPKARIFSIGPEKGFFTQEERSEVGPSEMAQLITSVSDAVTQAGYAWTAHPDFDLDNPGSSVVVSALDLTQEQFETMREAIKKTWATGMENASPQNSGAPTKKWVIGYFAIPVLDAVTQEDPSPSE